MTDDKIIFFFFSLHHSMNSYEILSSLNVTWQPKQLVTMEIFLDLNQMEKFGIKFTKIQ